MTREHKRPILPQPTALPNNKKPRRGPRKANNTGDETDVEYVVACIKDHRGRGGHREYLVQWAGFTADDDTWEDGNRLLEDVPQKVKAYLKAKKLEPVCTGRANNRL